MYILIDIYLHINITITKSTKMKTMSKIQKARLVMEVLIFIGIPTEQFSDLKKQYGGLDQLYVWAEKQLF